MVKMCKSKDVVSQKIMTRWLEKRDESALQDWIDTFSILSRGTKLRSEDIKKGLVANPMLFFSSPQTLCTNAESLQRLLRAEKIDLTKDVFFHKNVLNYLRIVQNYKFRFVIFCSVKIVLNIFVDFASIL